MGLLKKVKEKQAKIKLKFEGQVYKQSIVIGNTKIQDLKIFISRIFRVKLIFIGDVIHRKPLIVVC